MIGDRDAAEVDDEEQEPVGRGRAAPGAPEEAEPADGRDREGRDRVDLGLVRVLPVGEREGADQRRRERSAVLKQPRRPWLEPGGKTGERPAHHEEEEPRAECTQERAQEVGTDGEFADGHEVCPHVRHHHEEGRSRRMGNPEHLGRGDEFARVPERDRGRQRENVD